MSYVNCFRSRPWWVFYAVAAAITLSANAQSRPATGLVDAARQGNVKLATELLAQGADPNQRDPQGSTALHEAAYRGDLVLARILLHSGVKINAPDSAGITALHAACFDGRQDIAALLIKSGADVRQADRGGLTALHYAAAGGYPAIVKLLVTAGADVNARSSQGSTPILMAERAGKDQVVVLLRTLAPSPPQVQAGGPVQKARISITDDDLPSHPYSPEAAQVPAPTSYSNAASAPMSSWSSGRDSSSPSLDPARVRSLRDERDRLEAKLSSLRKECEDREAASSDSLSNNRALSQDQFARCNPV